MNIPIARTIEETRQAVAAARRKSLRIGLVPTMGALHKAHVSLMEAARKETGFVVVSLFVNPAQFGPKEDFGTYPRPFETDLEICGQAGVDLVFAPTSEEIYPPSFRTWVEVHGLQDVLCGASRPGHFRGVATVVLKLLNIVQPDAAYFGQKDNQQARIIRRMVEDLNVPVEVRVCPIVREPDGLAVSSRNVYLDPVQRQNATALSRSLAMARKRIDAGERDAKAIKHLIEAEIRNTPGAALDYAAVVDAGSLQPIDSLQGEIVIALAVKFGKTRLIDNMQMIV